MKQLSPFQVRTFRKKIYAYYKKHGRHSLPWRKTKNPYRILVSEVMLQQTQVSRVLPKYHEFLKSFPTVHLLAEAPLREVLRLWSGLGYNRRALLLHRTASIILKEYNGKIPRPPEALRLMPGIGSTTASAIAASLYNTPTVFLETNIRSVFIHEFFPRKKNITDSEIMALVKQTLDIKNPRVWYWALMDYGVMLKEKYKNPNTRSAHYTRQPSFRGSNREMRGAIIKILAKEKQATEKRLQQYLATQNISPAKSLLKDNLVRLEDEGLLQKKRSCYSLAA